MTPETNLREIILRTPRMALRLLAPEDREEFVRVHEVSRTLFDPWSPLLPADRTFDDLFTEQLAGAQRGVVDGTTYRFVGVLPDGRFAGFFSLSQIVRGVFHNAMASWRVNLEVARQGLCTQGVRALLDFAFTPQPGGLGLHRVQANIIPANLASIRVAEKNAFRLEGLAKNYLKIAGQWQDHLMYAKLAEEHALRGLAL
jgi:ribosomal-protein-alanine N-acetyltransferase